MRRRWLAPWRDSATKPAIYHVVSRVVERRLAFGGREKERFRRLMRAYEDFSGCRVLAYCLMSNHFHILLEVPPAPAGGIDDEELLRRLGAIYPRWEVREVGQRLAAARKAGDAAEAGRIHARFAYRMHDLSQFMKGLLQRFSSWFNRTHERSGRLWEQRFKSVLVEDGAAARTMAAYIDLNPVRAGVCEDPADYRWSSYGEAVAGGVRARAGLVRAWRTAVEQAAAEAAEGADGAEGAKGGGWPSARGWRDGGVARRYRAVLLGGSGAVEVVVGGVVKRRGMSRERVVREREELAALGDRDMRVARVIRQRVRYFTDGAVIGGREFVNEVFRRCREHFGPRRKDGARKPRGVMGELAGELWSARDLRVDTG
jgi:REP element-mobilizing transposase RayT